MTRMSTDEALNIVDELRAHRRPAFDVDPHVRADAAARVALLVAAARTANNDDLGDPHQVVTDLASPTLSKRQVMRWFSTLIEAITELDALVAWRNRTHGQHHADSAAQAECITTYSDRAALAAAVLLGRGAEVEAAFGCEVAA